jgi:PPP family 3-phenylpropionic acid transporter
MGILNSAPLKIVRLREGAYLKSLYFTIWAAIGAFWPFIYVYYRSEIGLTGAQIGLIVMIGAGTGTLSAPLWGMLNDRLGRTRLILTIQALGLVAVCLILGQLRTFSSILVAAGIFSIFSSPIMPLLDSTTLRLLGDRRDLYGSYRAWGTIGFVITCALAGFLIERIGMGLIFGAYSAGVFIFWLLSLRLPDQRGGRGPSRLAGLSQMVRQRAWLIFAVSVFILWFSVMGAFAFLGIVIVEMGGAQSLIGLAATLAALTEIPTFQYSARLLRRFGPPRLLAIAMGVYVLRLLLYALMPTATWTLWLALLQGASYGIFLVGAVAYANELAPTELKSTAQGLLVSVMSLANLGAGLAGGWLLDHAGRSGLFTAMMLTCLVALGVFVVGWRRGRSKPTIGY